MTGLPGEARAARGAGAAVLCADGSPARARAHAEALAGSGAAGLVSFGVAGGLDPGLRPGTVVVATEIAAPGGASLGIDREWAGRLAARLGPALAVVRAPVAGVPEPVGDAAARAALAEASGAAAVDMESREVALAAAEAGLPVLAVRAIADPAGRALPASALAAFGVARAGRAGAFVELCRRPGDWAALARLAMDYRRRACRAARRRRLRGVRSCLSRLSAVATPGTSANRARARARR